jgi:small subunit ribosomal protein S6
MSKKTRRGAVGEIRHYETVIVIDPQIGDEAVKAIVEKAKDVITHSHATITKVDEWGKRKLVYAIKKRTYGQYVCIEFEGGGDVVKHLQEFYHITEDVLRYLTVLVDSRLRDERKRERTPPVVAEEILV